MANKHTGFTRRQYAAVGLSGVLGLLAGGAWAADPFPSKPVTVIAPYAPGSGPDAMMRKIAEVLGRKWKQPVLIDNRPGGAGFVAIEAARRAPADGYTLLLLDTEHVSALPHLYKKRGFATLEVFDPLAVIYRATFLVAVSAGAKLNNVADLIAAARAADGQMTYGSWAVGSAGHLGGVRLEQLTGVKMQHVAFRDVSQLYISVANGDVAWALGSLPSSRAAYDAGKLRYLAVAAPKRLPQLPNIPTLAEAGGPPNFHVNSDAVLVARKGIPESLANKINSDVAEAIAHPDVKAALETYAFEPLHWSKDEILKQVQARSEMYKSLIERNSISLD